MKLLTLNTHAWLENDQLEKINILARTIAEKDYDLIAFQEVNQSIFSKKVHGDIKKDNYLLVLIEYLKKYTDQSYYYTWSNSHIGYGRYDEGIAILSKYPLKKIDSFYCTETTTIFSIESRKIIGVTIEYLGENIEFYSCHINLPNSKKENQLENIKNIINRTSENNLKFFLGDFNTDAINNEQDYNNILNLGLKDTYNMARKKDSGVTVEKNIDGWKNSFSEKRLDYIFTNKEILVEESNVIFNGINKDIVSDHYGLEVTIQIK